MKKIFVFLAVVGMSWLMAGCVNTVNGRAQAGVPFLKDSVQGQYERPANEVFEAAKAVLAYNGTLTGENTINSSLDAKVNQRSVFVRIDQIDPAKPLTGVTVQVRTKSGASDIDLAHELEKQIALKLVH